MNARFTPATLNGKTEAQSLKSMAMRYFTIASLAQGQTKIYLKNETEDLSALKEAFSDVGVSFYRDKSVYTVAPPTEWETFYMRCDVKDSLYAFRFILPALLSKSNRVEFSGQGRLSKKDVTMGVDLLGTIIFDSKTLPALVSGGIKSGEFIVTKETNSQLLSALLIALPLLNGDSKIVFTEKPKKQLLTAIEFTTSAMAEFGVLVQKTDNGYLVKGSQTYLAPEKTLVVEGDYATAGYFLGANLLGSCVEVENLNKDSLQAEKVIENHLLSLKEGQGEIDLKGKTTWVYLLTVIACKMEKTTTFLGVKVKDKELDDFNEFIRTLNVLGASVSYEQEKITVKGKSALNGEVLLDSMGNSKIAMAYVMLASVLDSPVTVLSVEAGMSEQSSFINEYIRLGGKCQIV